MEFQKFLLDDYMKTDEGLRITNFFRNLKKTFKNRFEDDSFFKFVNRLLTIDHGASGFPSEKERWISVASVSCETFDEFENEFRISFDSEYEARDFQGFIPKYSVDLYCKYPEFAFPYLFVWDFYRMRFVCELLNIPLPVLPSSRRHSDRFNYYFVLCRALYEFRVEHGLKPLEMCVLVYGFAMRYIGSFISNSYGEANRVYIVGATQYDVEEGVLKHPTDRTVSTWQGNVEMLPGDIVIVYETSPYSRIRSIWRAVSPGFDDPFRYYPGAVYLGHPILVPCVGIKELKADPVWSRKGLVKASMQGVNGKVCTVEEYDALKQMFKRIDPAFDLGKIPTPPPYARFYHDNLVVERDVEEQLLEPLLRKIGFHKWVRQLPLRMGRGDRVFPDYALNVRGYGDDAAADFIWEAKYRIPSVKQLKIDFGQAKSYALRLQSKALGLVAMEGIWYVTQNEGYVFEKLHHFTWEQLANPDAIAQLRQAFR